MLPEVGSSAQGHSFHNGHTIQPQHVGFGNAGCLPRSEISQPPKSGGSPAHRARTSPKVAETGHCRARRSAPHHVHQSLVHHLHDDVEDEGVSQVPCRVALNIHGYHEDSQLRLCTESLHPLLVVPISPRAAKEVQDHKCPPWFLFQAPHLLGPLAGRQPQLQLLS